MSDELIPPLTKCQLQAKLNAWCSALEDANYHSDIEIMEAFVSDLAGEAMTYNNTVEREKWPKIWR